jgi:putative restriction endonuclease
MAAPRKPWTRDELVIAINLYCKLPFGQLDSNTPIIIEVADRLERTPGSIAMKLCNLASLDPVQQSRGIKGLSGVSKADRQIWEEFSHNWDELGIESEEKFQALFQQDAKRISPYLEPDSAGEKGKLRKVNSRNYESFITSFPNETESLVTSKKRIGQSFFRRAVLTAYENRCCITGNPVPELLVASHIIPWRASSENRLNPMNGLCLSRTHDTAFDQGLITFDHNQKLVLSKYLQDFLPEKTLEENFVQYQGQAMCLPTRFQPDLEFLRYHREEIFLSA